MDSHNFAISNAAPPPSVQHAVPDDQPNQAAEDAFEQQLDAARAADSAGLARRPGRKPPPNVSRADFNYIHEIMSGVSARRKLSPLTAEKYAQMLYKVANYLGERGQSLEASDDNTLNQLSDTVFKENKHVGMALRALQEQRGGSPAVRVRRARAATSMSTGRTRVAPTEVGAPLIESVIDEGIKSKHWAPATVQHHDTMLRKLSNSLGMRGETLAGTSDDALYDYVKEAFPKNWKRMTGSLWALREHRGGLDGSEQVSSASDGPDQAKSSAAAGSPRSDLIPEALWRLLDDDDRVEPSVMAENPELLRQEQELRDQIEGGWDDQSNLLSPSTDREEFTSDPEDLMERPAKRRRTLDRQSVHSPVSVDPGELTLNTRQVAPAEPSQLLANESALLDPDPLADELTAPADPDAFTFAPLPLSPGELSRLLDIEPTPSGPDQLAQEVACSLGAEASVIARAPLSPGKLWRLLDDESTPPLPDQLFDRHSSSIDQNVFSSDSLPLSPGEFARLIYDPPGGVDQFAGHLPLQADTAALDFEYLPFSPGELRGLLDDEPVPSGPDQPLGNLPVSADPDAFIFNEEPMPPGELRRLLEDEPASSAADQPPRRFPSNY
ncbi:hypothetical protein MTR72_15220 [Bradyrhizobium sp. ISRA442]|uniref:hypothetical protein n=1 Tax=Bradyrhizobium sp. ISRA442 TaxID=2866197 RepID=UPI00311ACD93